MQHEPDDSKESFQARVDNWMQACFGSEIAADQVERCDRFLEEGLELVQAVGYDRSRAYQLVDYVFSRPVGDTPQEIGGVCVTLAALCNALTECMVTSAEAELSRISEPAVTEIIRAKQAAKAGVSSGPLPIYEKAPWERSGDDDQS